MISFPTWIKSVLTAPEQAHARPSTGLNLGNFSLRAKLLAGFAGILLLMLGVSAVSFRFQKITLDQFRKLTEIETRISDLAATSSVAMLVARRNEKDFLLRYKDYGLSEAKSRYLTQVWLAVAQIHENMAEIRRLDDDDADTITLAHRIDEIVSEYEGGLRDTVKLHEQLGHVQSGLEGAFREKAQELEQGIERTGSSMLLAGYLELRRREKDYLLRGRDIDRRLFVSGLEKFERELARTTVAPVTKSLLRLAKDYSGHFLQYVRIDEEIERRSERYLGAASVVEPLLEEMRLREQQEMTNTQVGVERFGRFAEITIIAAGIGALLLGLLIAGLFFRNITGMVREYMIFAQQVAGGKLDAEIIYPGTDEFSRLATALNSMTASLRGAHDAQVARQRELQQANDALQREFSEKMRAEENLKESNEALQTIIESSPLAMFAVDRQGLVRVWNHAAESMFGWSAAESIGRPPPAIALPGQEEEIAELRKLVFSGATRSGVESQRRHKDGTILDVSLWFSPLRNAQGEVIRVLGVIDDISERKRIERNLEHLAQYDSLTNLPNRSLFRDRLEQTVAQAKRSGRSAAVLFLDLDRFKLVNDTLGHAIGDKLLKQAAARLSECTRSGDTVGRFGGDEFGVILSELAKPGDASLVAEKIIDTLARPFDLEGHSTFVSGSVGITLYPADATDPEVLIMNADTAMYRAKEKGRNNYQFFTQEMNERAMLRMRMEASMRQALERGEFLLHYQPKVQIAGGAICGIEALLRWAHPERGLVSPAEFMPVLEETGLIIPVGEWVTREACRQIRAWQQAGLKVPPVAVNLSARQFQQKGLEAGVRDILRDTGVDPSLLQFEITESLLMNDPEGASRTLRGLKEAGVKLSVDDFGTGYSSLAYLKRFPLDALKIDRAFIKDIVTDPDDAAITLAVISLAHSLKLKVVAEGVETEAQLNLLALHSCDEMQGYYFSKPVAGAQLEAILREGRRLTRAKGGTPTVPAVLLLDDNKSDLELLEKTLRSDEFEVLTATSVEGAFTLLATHPVGIVVSDQNMPGMSGAEFLGKLRKLYPDALRVAITGAQTPEAIADAVNEAGVYKFLSKDWDPERLRAEVREAYLHYRTAAVGRSPRRPPG